MATKDSLLTYQDGNLANIAAIYGDRLQSLCLVEKFAILTDIGAWGDQCCSYEESDWSSFGEYMAECSDTPKDYDVYSLLTHPDCDWVDPKFAMPLVVAVCNQIAEGIYLPEDAES